MVGPTLLYAIPPKENRVRRILWSLVLQAEVMIIDFTLGFMDNKVPLFHHGIVLHIVNGQLHRFYGFRFFTDSGFIQVFKFTHQSDKISAGKVGYALLVMPQDPVVINSAGLLFFRSL